MLRIARFISHFESNGDGGLWVFFLVRRLQQSFNNQFVFFICLVLYVSLKQSRVFSYQSSRPKDDFICITILLQRRKKEACNFSLCSSPDSLIILIFHFPCALPLMIPHFLSHCFIKEHIFLSPTTFCGSSFCFLLSSSLPSHFDTLPPCIILLLHCFSLFFPFFFCLTFSFDLFLHVSHYASLPKDFPIVTASDWSHLVLHQTSQRMT